MKMLLDINIVLDFFLEREPFFDEIYKIFSAIENKKVIGYLCASSIDTIYYLIAKSINKRTANEVIYKLLKIFEISEVNKNTILGALKSDFNDFEDSIIYSSAYLNGIDYIVTRDKKGFKKSKVKVLTPLEAVSKIKGL
ncbi:MULTISPECIES: PIN domain-containing protein [unclassified Lebetimonas]|uniref:PIN domain-containing protein n=1 Tax=unclassified Lebetimonas TaxID=2648158 RepID=UPI0004639CC2|nr:MULTISPECIES: PIN domain-containing protein [unclassified Lebetimonas]